jgi:predicted nuclease of restriction endonuclease-like (RecB) superfamily
MKNDPAVLATPEYRKFIEELKARVTAARISAARHVNRDLILLYWDIGRGIVEKQQILGWGESVVEMVSADLRRAFPQMIGFSPRNLRDMKRFYLAYTDEAIWRQPVAKLRQHTKWPQVVAKVGSETVIEILQKLIAEIPWGHNLLILNKLSDPAARLYYLRAAAQFGWSRNVLLNQIKARTYERAVTEAKTHNFPAVLPEYFAEQAEDTLKSSYCLEFLGIKREIKERELEDRLIEQLQNFIKTPPRHEGQIAIGQTTPRRGPKCVAGTEGRGGREIVTREEPLKTTAQTV